MLDQSADKAPKKVPGMPGTTPDNSLVPGRSDIKSKITDVLGDKRAIRESGEFETQQPRSEDKAETRSDDITAQIGAGVALEVHETTDPYLEKLKRLKAFYEAVCASSHEGKGMEETHALFVESLYSHRILPLLTALQAQDSENPEVQKAVDRAVGFMGNVNTYAESHDITPYEAFLALYDGAVAGENDFLMQMKRARDGAITSIHQGKEVLEGSELATEVEKALKEHLEAEMGLEFPQHFIERLEDENTKAMVVSLDFNSTFNLNESYPSADLVARAQRSLHKFAQSFRTKMGGKELIIAVNTGRPGMYAWGAVEAAFAPIPEMRKVAVAEAGGVLLDEGLHTGVMQVAVENPREWQSELDNIRVYLLDKIADPQNVVIEPKLSMLSIKLAQDEEYSLRAKDGALATPEWIQAQLQEYFVGVEQKLDDEFNDLMTEMQADIPNAEDFVASLRNVEGKIVNGNKRKAMTELKSIIAEVKEDHKRRMEEIKARLATIEQMHEKGLLRAKYNPTAGYVDIGHAHLNKYSTLMKHVCAKENLSPDEVLFVQIGDSNIDVIPEELTAQGEPNEGAEKAFLVAVENSNEKMQRAIERRGGQGLTTARPSILGVEAMFKGLTRAVSKVG